MKVLLVEDTEMLADSTRRLLEMHAVEVVWAQDAAEGVRLLGEQEFELVVSDYSLGPGEKGDSVLKAAAELQPSARRILMSGEQEARWVEVQGIAQRFYLKDSRLARHLLEEARAAGLPEERGLNSPA